MYEVRSAEFIIYESIVIEFFLRLTIHKIGKPISCPCVLENIICIVSMGNYET